MSVCTTLATIFTVHVLRSTYLSIHHGGAAAGASVKAPRMFGGGGLHAPYPLAMISQMCRTCEDNEKASSGVHRCLGFEQWSLIMHRRKLTGTAAYMSEVV